MPETGLTLRVQLLANPVNEDFQPVGTPVVVEEAAQHYVTAANANETWQEIMLALKCADEKGINGA